MAGGTFDPNVPKVRPGIYTRIQSARQSALGTQERGIVLLPLIDFPYGPAGEFITIDISAPDAQRTVLGYSVYAPEMLLVHEALKAASQVVAYIPAQGAKATATEDALTATARQGGARGNDLKFSVVANPVSGFDVAVFLNTEKVSEYTGLATIENLIAQGDAWIEFGGEGNLQEVAATSLSGGTTGVATNENIMAMLDAAENVRWQTLAFPVQPSGASDETTIALQAAVASRVIAMRDAAGKGVQAVMANYGSNHEAVINVVNGVTLDDGVSLTAAQATAWVAGITAGATGAQSNTYRIYDGAAAVNGTLTSEQAVAAIQAGKAYFSLSELNEVIFEYDINSLITFDAPKDQRWSKNKIIRIFDTLRERILATFRPGQFSNTETQWDAIEGLGGAILVSMQSEGMLTGVEAAEDFKVDRARSIDDHLYVDVWMQPVDTADKMYFSIFVR